MTRYEKLNLRVNVIGHFLTLGLVFLTFVELNNVKEQYKLNTEQYKLNTEQFELNIKQYNSNYEQQKKGNTIKYLQSLHELVKNTDENLLEILKYYDIDNENISMISRKELEKILEDNHQYRKQLDDLYIGFNQFAIGCREGFFDEMTAWSANYDMVFNMAKALIPYYELIENEWGYSDKQFYGCFLRIMAFRWEHDGKMGIKYNKMIEQLSEETTNATGDSIPIIRRMPDVTE